VVEETLAKLVAYPTVSSEPVEGIAAYLADRCDAAGFVVERLDAPAPGKCNLVARKGPEGSDGIVLTGHMDVVPVAGQPWTSDPWTLTQRDGRLHGRGACDMKAFLAAVAEALPRLGRLEKEVLLVFTHDEEVGCLGSRALVERMAGRPVPRACWVGEPTSFQVLRMHPGHVAVTLRTTGRAAHSSKPDLGENAILKVGPLLRALEALAETWRSRTRFAELLERPYPVVNVGRIRGGVAVNVVPDLCEIELGFRPLPGMDEGAMIAEVATAIAPWAVVVAKRTTPALLTDEGTPLQDLLSAHASRADLGAATFATDGGNLARLGMAPLVFGPGSIDVAHQADEFVPRDELHRCVDMVEQVVRARCGAT
jgi:acetylornithine deacetylase